MRESGIFTIENDAAQEWLGAFLARPDYDHLRQTLLAATEDDFLEVETACRALVAAELVAALAGKPSGRLPDDVMVWVEGQDITLSRDLRVLSERAVERVLSEDSELRTRWEEDSGVFRMWKDSLDGLMGRLV
jgi:hypothetical protein